MEMAREIEVMVVRARDLKRMAVFGVNQPLATAWVRPGGARSTHIAVNGGANPEWNERLLVPIDERHLHARPLAWDLLVEVSHHPWSTQHGGGRCAWPPPPLLCVHLPIGTARIPADRIAASSSAALSSPASSPPILTFPLVSRLGRPHGFIDLTVRLLPLPASSPSSSSTSFLSLSSSASDEEEADSSSDPRASMAPTTSNTGAPPLSLTAPPESSGNHPLPVLQTPSDRLIPSRQPSRKYPPPVPAPPVRASSSVAYTPHATENPSQPPPSHVPSSSSPNPATASATLSPSPRDLPMAGPPRTLTVGNKQDPASSFLHPSLPMPKPPLPFIQKTSAETLHTVLKPDFSPPQPAAPKLPLSEGSARIPITTAPAMILDNPSSSYTASRLAQDDDLSKAVPSSVKKDKHVTDKDGSGHGDGRPITPFTTDCTAGRGIKGAGRGGNDVKENVKDSSSPPYPELQHDSELLETDLDEYRKYMAISPSDHPSYDPKNLYHVPAEYLDQFLNDEQMDEFYTRTEKDAKELHADDHLMDMSAQPVNLTTKTNEIRMKTLSST
ncbi:hypothetical protein KP509_28G036200 [Ceratopteris richardii]|uniref:C2 domain-containing protein n=1 Tax=Ceratopteris richardii TaxID=49495 RepID=A0A8T2RB72_CERRI|nr:hypothetical protein KP509_28G036200 [Ceratopteris richardii]